MSAMSGSTPSGRGASVALRCLTSWRRAAFCWRRSFRFFSRSRFAAVGRALRAILDSYRHILPARVGAPPGPAAAAAIAAAPAASAAAESAAATWARRLRPRFIHGQRASAHLVAVELRDRLLRIIVARHFDEGEAARAPGDAVAHDGDGLDLARLPEQRLEILFHR